MSKFAIAQGLALLAAFAGLTIGPDRAAADLYVIDPKHTEVRFGYTFGLSRQWGRFKSVNGSMQFDAGAPEKTRVNAVIKTASLTVEEAAFESALKGRQFFDAERRPEITFRSQAVQLTAGDKARMSGAITVNGITQPITLEVSLKSGDDPRLKYRNGSQRFVARGQMRRSAFNMTGYSAVVSDEIAIEIDALLRKKNPKSAAN